MSRSLILCFDDTSDPLNDHCTNVRRFFEALEENRPDEQLCRYLPVIGTDKPSWSSARRLIAKKLDQTFARYLHEHILGGYHFLMENYQEGDYVCIFGFGRGAYIARCLAGMLSKVGLVPKVNEELVASAFQIYLDTTPKGFKDSQTFRRTYSTPVPIAFVGVWETVASAGWTFKRFPFTSSNTIIRRFRHALALDENRVEYLPNPWHCGSFQDLYGVKRDPSWETEVFEDDFEYHLGKPTDVKEVWFAGRHADVGGGSSRRDDIHSLANPSFLWMVSEVLRHSPYVLFRPNAFEDENGFSALTITKTDLIPKPARAHIPTALYPTVTRDPSPSPSLKPLPLVNATAASAAPNGREVEEEQTVVVVEQTDPEADANAPMNDQLVKGLMWLILEYIPMSQIYQDSDGYWHRRFRWNARRPREVYNSTPNFHASVKLRKDYEGKWLTRFIPKAGELVKINYVE